MIVDPNRPAHYVGIGAEQVLPRAVAQYGDRGRRQHIVLPREESPADHRFHSQHGEIVPAHQLPPHDDGCVRRTDRHWSVHVCREVREHLVLLFVVQVVGVRGVAVSLAADSRGEDRHQLLRRGHVERPVQQGIDDAEDGRVDSDAERQ